MDWLIIGSAKDLRVQRFQDALKNINAAPAKIVGYQDNWQDKIPSLLTQNTCLRIEAPNQLSDVRYLLKRGLKHNSNINNLEILTDKDIDNADLERGEFFAPHQFYFGLKNKLEQLQTLVNDSSIIGCMNHIPDIFAFFDKQHCHQALSTQKIMVADGIYDVSSYADLRGKMRTSGHKNVFIKTRFGSGASGIVALKTNGTNGSKVHSLSTIEQYNGGLYNTRRLQQCNKETDVASLIDRLCKWGVHCEQWIPKAVIGKKEVDCRVLLINGKANFFVLRKSNTPITNLHLLNERASVQELINIISDDAWEQVIDTCNKITAMYPKSFTIAADIAVHRNLQDHCVLELNAFGDFLQNIEHKGMNPQAWQLEQFKSRHKLTPTDNQTYSVLP